MNVAKWIIPDNLDVMPHLKYTWSRSDWQLVRNNLVGIISVPDIGEIVRFNPVYIADADYSSSGEPVINIRKVTFSGDPMFFAVGK